MKCVITGHATWIYELPGEASQQSSLQGKYWGLGLKSANGTCLGSHVYQSIYISSGYSAACSDVLDKDKDKDKGAAHCYSDRQPSDYSGT